MKYTEMGFRGIYRQLNALKLTDQIRKTIADFPDADKANCVLTYGYIDHEAGVTLEILAGAKKDGNRFRFFNGNDSIRSFIRIEAVENDDLFWFEDADNSIKSRYSEKIKMLQGYDVSEEIEKTRGMSFLDESRDPHCVDDVLVYLTREGLQPEGCWVRISGLGDHWIMGTLLNEPNQNFGYHLNETIAFFVQETEDKKVICYSDMTPSMKLTADDLADSPIQTDLVTNTVDGQDGVISVTGLDWGTYYFKEISSPSGYNPAAIYQEFTVSAETAAVGCDINNVINERRKGEVVLNKTVGEAFNNGSKDYSVDDSVPGAKFSLYTAEGEKLYVKYNETTGKYTVCEAETSGKQALHWRIR